MRLKNKMIIGVVLMIILATTGAMQLRARGGADAAQINRPSILFLLPTLGVIGGIDLTYLRELHKKGFEVNYTDDLHNLTIEKLKRHNVVVIYAVETAWVPSERAFVELIEKYLEMGGGVFVVEAREYDITRRITTDLMPRWGIRVPAETIKEGNPRNVTQMTNMIHHVPAIFTDNINPNTPVSQGVRQVWYPLMSFLFGKQQTRPLWVDGNWQVVVRASPTAITEPIDAITMAKWPAPPVDPFVRPEGRITAPPIFAIRSYKAGRIAYMSIWHQFTFGYGTKWLYNREILSKGFKDRPSDLGRLIENTFQWLAEPSLQRGFPGGARTDHARLVPSTMRPDARRGFEERLWTQDPETIRYGRPPAGHSLYRGVIGVKTTFSTGKNTVGEYARAARELGIDFLIFTDDFAELTPEEFDQLRADTIKYSDAHLQLFPGYAIQNTIGNSMFIFGPRTGYPGVTFPPAPALTGPNRTLLSQQAQDEAGNWEKYDATVLTWIVIGLTNQHIAGGLDSGGNVGFYNFTASDKKGGMDMPDLRTYSMAAVRFYTGGRLVEDRTEDFLMTAQGTLPPSPVSFNLVTSVDELRGVIENNQSLTYVRASSLTNIYVEGLRYTHQFESVPVFVSNGPLIWAWTGLHRPYNFAGENFVTGRIFMPSYINVTSDKGLREIRIYNGQELFRRFILNGEKEFSKMLYLEGVVQKTLVLIAEDIAGGRAISNPRVSYADTSSDAVLFCSDRVNDCKPSLQIVLARGPFHNFAIQSVPRIPDSLAGITWDGGPPALAPLNTFYGSWPHLDSNKGIQDGQRLTTVPWLEFTCETSSATSSVKTDAIKDEVPVVHMWVTYGPKRPANLFHFTRRFRTWLPPTVGVDIGWAGSSIRAGIEPSLFRGIITFQEDLRINSLRLLKYWGRYHMPDVAYLLVFCTDTKTINSIEYTNLRETKTFRIGKGGWFVFTSPEVANGHLIFNRTEPIYLKISNPDPQYGEWVWARIYADMRGRQVRKGDTYIYELASLAFPMDTTVKTKDDFVYMVNYLSQPDGMEILRGKKVEPGHGIVELDGGKDYVVEAVIPRPKRNTNLTLPIRIAGLNNRWSAGLFLREGYVLGSYGKGIDRYTHLGIDVYGYGYVNAHVDMADRTHFVAGHPVVADTAEGKDLFIQVTPLSGGTGYPPTRYTWVIQVNNPTNHTIGTTLRKTMDLPGLEDFTTKEIEIKPGENMTFRFLKNLPRRGEVFRFLN